MRRIFGFVTFLAVFSALLWMTSVAFGRSDGGSAPEGVRVEVAERAAAPDVTFMGGAVGSVAPGDLFFIDTGGSSRDLVVDLYLTNAPALVRYLRYLVLEVSIAAESGFGQSPAESLYLTLKNSHASFVISGDSLYTVGIVSGSYCCFPARAGGACEPPRFYLVVGPA